MKTRTFYPVVVGQQIKGYGLHWSSQIFVSLHKEIVETSEAWTYFATGFVEDNLVTKVKENLFLIMKCTFFVKVTKACVVLHSSHGLELDLMT